MWKGPKSDSDQKAARTHEIIASDMFRANCLFVKLYWIPTWFFRFQDLKMDFVLGN